MTLQPRSTKLKLLLCGRVAILKSYEKEIWYNTKYPRIKKTRTEKEDRTEEQKLDIRKRSSSRAKSNVFNLISTNAWFWNNEDGKPFLPVFLTLTFAKNIQDIEAGNELHSKFIKRLNYHVYKAKTSKLKYISVIEFQKRGAIHYHIIFFNLPYIHKKELADIWDLGFIQVKKIDERKNVAGYLTKYMTKGNKDSRLEEKKRYMCSRGLLKPVEINNQSEVIQLARKIPNSFVKNTYDYDSEYMGKVYVTEYDFGKCKTIKDVVYYS